MAALTSALVMLVAAAEVQSGAVRVRHEGQQAEAERIAAALNRAAAALPGFVGARDLEVHARITASTGLTRLTGLPPTVAAGVVEDEIVFPPARVTARFEDLDQVARHEVAHLALLGHSGKVLPRWFVEGFASVLAGEAAGPAGGSGCARPGQVLSLDLLLVSPDPSLREAGYRRAAAAVRETAHLAGGPEALWNALAGHPSGKKLLALRFEKKTVAELYREAATCP